MTEEPLRRQSWLAVVAALLAALAVYDAIGLWAGVMLLLLTAAAFIFFRLRRRKRVAEGPVLYCLKCGERLAATARECKFCGSASWSYKN
jgi:ribosomal protein L40E